MKQLSFLMLIIISQISCKPFSKMNSNSEKHLQISIEDLEKLSDSECQKIEFLFLYDPKKVVVSQHVINEEIISREDDIKKNLHKLKKFKNLRNLYFMNIHMTEIPKEILVLNKLEELCFLFLNHFSAVEQLPKLKKLKKLKRLIINIDFLEESQVEILRQNLQKIEVVSI